MIHGIDTDFLVAVEVNYRVFGCFEIVTFR